MRGALSAADGDSTVGLSGASLGPGGDCVVTVSVVADAPGAFGNETSDVTGTIAGELVIGNTGSDTFFVLAGPIVTKEFTDDPVGSGGAVTLEFTITNSDQVNDLTDIAFTDVFDEILPTASVVPANPVCGGSLSYLPLRSSTATRPLR